MNKPIILSAVIISAALLIGAQMTTTISAIGGTFGVSIACGIPSTEKGSATFQLLSAGKVVASKTLQCISGANTIGSPTADSYKIMAKILSSTGKTISVGSQSGPLISSSFCFDPEAVDASDATVHAEFGSC